MNVYLVGMPGSGKSTLGQFLAQKLNFNFVDLDILIEEKEQCSITDIFSNEGEDYFRKVEQEVLHSTGKLEDTIIATGGGTPCFLDNMNWINTNGLSIYIKINLDVLKKRLTLNNLRPLLKKTTLDNLFKEREQFYLMAKHTCHNN